MFQNLIEILILSAIQGVSEFLPISSSAHLIIVSNLYDLKSSSLLIDISLHLGSLLAIIFFFKKDLFDLKNNKKLIYGNSGDWVQHKSYMILENGSINLINLE